jgi:superoxide dismutase, Fe-Mn family
MPFVLPELPYGRDALAPVLSKETLDYHYGKHHNTYVVNLNKLTEGTPYAGWSLEDLIRRNGEVAAEKRKPVFNNAAQIWNHTFYWEGFAPAGSGGSPSAGLTQAIDRAFGGTQGLMDKLQAESLGHFGSGWGWLVKQADGSLAVTSTHDADTPIAHGQTPLLTFDVWEHAYYIDYRNVRADYLKRLWEIVNWGAVSARFGA